MNFLRQADQWWNKISASLRQGRLYVKMPREKVISFVAELAQVNQDLLWKETYESDKAFVFSGSTDDWKEDLQVLKALEPQAVVQELIAAIEAGLRNEPQVDWISRIGGPPREEDAALENLEENDRRPRGSLHSRIVQDK